MSCHKNFLSNDHLERMIGCHFKLKIQGLKVCSEDKKTKYITEEGEKIAK